MEHIVAFLGSKWLQLLLEREISNIHNQSIPLKREILFSLKICALFFEIHFISYFVSISFSFQIKK